LRKTSSCDNSGEDEHRVVSKVEAEAGYDGSGLRTHESKDQTNDCECGDTAPNPNRTSGPFEPNAPKIEVAVPEEVAVTL